MTNKIVVVGSCMIDLVSYATRLPKSGETIHGFKFAVNFGGKGANQCVAAAKLGGETALVARLGDDSWGLKYLENLANNHVNVEHVKITESSNSGIAQIIVSEEGENQIVIVAGANQKLSIEDVDNAKDIIRTAAVLIVQLETSVEVAIRAMELGNGISILNGAPALTSYDKRLLKLPTIFCVNENEAAIFTDLPVTNLEEVKIAAKHLIRNGCQNVIITLGEKGAIYASPSRDCNHKEQSTSFYSAASPKVNSIDSTGAGDAFIGALGYFLAVKHLTVEKAIDAACFLAADSVTRLGTQTSFAGADVFHRMEQ